MPRKCSVPGCNSNYASQQGYVSVYSFPKDAERKQKWIKLIHRKDYEPGTTAVVCAKHFDDKFFIKEDCAQRPDGSILVVPRKVWALTQDAYPSIFPNQPSYLSSLPPPKRRTPAERESELLQRDDDNFRQLMENDRVKSFEEFIVFCAKSVPVDWIFSSTAEAAVFLKINYSDSPTILGSVKFDSDLNVQVWKNNILVSESTYMHLFGKSKKCDTYMKFEAFIELVVLNLKENVASCNKMAFACSLLKDCLKEEDLQSSVKTTLSFISEQLDILQMKHPKYSSDCLIWSCSLLYSYPSAYRYVRNSKMLTLPSPVYLKRFCSELNSNCIGLSPYQINYLISKYGLLSDEEKLVNLLIDEIYVKPNLSFKNGTINGVALNSDQCIEEATTIQAYMISSIFSTNKDVVALFPVKNLNASHLFKFTDMVLKTLTHIGYHVLTIISDNNRINRNMFVMYGGGQLKICITNPYNDKQKLFFFFDTVHLLKSVRNNWLNQTDCEQTFTYPAMKNRFFTESSSLPEVCHSSISVLKKLHESEASKPVKKAHMLSKKVLCPTKLERQNVSYAVCLFHDTNLAALQVSEGLKNRMETHHFLKIMSSWWKIVNVKHPEKGKHLRDDFCYPIVNLNDDKLNFLKCVTEWLTCWNELAVTSNKSRHGKLTCETHTALLHTTKALCELSAYLIKEMKASYVLLGKFQTDNIESRFGQYRQMSGANYNISVRQVLESEKRLKIVNLLRLKSSKRGDFEVKEFLHKCGEPSDNSVVLHSQPSTKLVDAIEEARLTPLPQEEIMILVYISGYVASHVGACAKCESLLLCQDPLDYECSEEVSTYLKVIDRGGLKWPKEFTVNICINALQIFRVLVSEEFEAEFLHTKNHRAVLLELSMECAHDSIPIDFNCECGKSAKELARRCIIIMCNILLKNYCKLKNEAVLSKKSSKSQKSPKTSKTSPKTSKQSPKTSKKSPKTSKKSPKKASKRKLSTLVQK